MVASDKVVTAGRDQLIRLPAGSTGIRLNDVHQLGEPWYAMPFGGTLRIRRGPLAIRLSLSDPTAIPSIYR